MMTTVRVLLPLWKNDHQCSQVLKPVDKYALAQQCGKALFRHDRASASLGIEYLHPAFKGDTLTAQATEMARTRHTGSYVVSVVNQEEKTIAVFHGRSSTREQPLVPEQGIPTSHE